MHKNISHILMRDERETNKKKRKYGILYKYYITAYTRGGCLGEKQYKSKSKQEIIIRKYQNIIYIYEYMYNVCCFKAAYHRLYDAKL
jgi:hypothetical protein